MDYTNSFKLRLPLPTEKYNIDLQNENMKIIDKNMRNLTESVTALTESVKKVPFDTKTEDISINKSMNTAESIIGINGVFIPNANCNIAIFDCDDEGKQLIKENTKYRISGCCSAYYPLVTFEDADGEILGYAFGNDAGELTQVNEYEVITPKGTTTMYVNYFNTMSGEAASLSVIEVSEKFEVNIESLSEAVRKILEGCEQTKNKGMPGGYAGLDEKGDIFEKQIPDGISRKSEILNVETTHIEPNNYAPRNAETKTLYGVTVTLKDNVITATGTFTGTGNYVFNLGPDLTSEGGYYWIQLWDASGDVSDLARGALFVNKGAYGSVNSNAENGKYSRYDTTVGDTVSIGVMIREGFTGSVSFKLSLSRDKLDAYEEPFEPYEETTFTGLKREVIPDEVKATGNLLYGKKWAVCGDSFTHGDFKNALDEDYTITEGKYVGKNKVYGYLIGNRNSMEIQHLAVGGRTMAMPADGSFTNAFSNEMYKTIDADVDYITLYFGINDSHHRPKATGSDGEDTTGVIELGTIDDTTTATFYGAWNVVLEYLITNYPNAHIGIIVSNGCETHDYPTAEIELANKWGIPYIDLNGDERTPMMLRSTNPNKSSVAKKARLQAWAVNPSSNTHPNSKAHEYESVVIENWLRTL